MSKLHKPELLLPHKNKFMNTKITCKTDSLSKSNLIQLLKTFSKNEIKEFDKFIRSPFFNNRNEVTKYFTMLKKYYPLFNHQDFSKGKIHTKLYPGKKYKDNDMRRLSSGLFKLSEDFLALSNFNRYEYPYSTHLLESLTGHGQDELFLKTYNNIMGKFNNKKISDKTFEIKRVYENLFIGHNDYMSRFFSVASNCMDKGIYDILIFFSRLPLDYAEILGNSDTYNYEPKQNLIEKFVLNFNFEGFLKDINFTQNKFLKVLPVYVYQLLLVQYLDIEDYFYQYKSAVLEHRNILSDSELNMHFSNLNDYCVNKINHGNNKFLQEAYEICNFMIEEQLIFFENNFFQIVSFSNIVDNCLGAGKIEFVEKFIEGYGDKLAPDVKKDMLSLCHARVYFEKNEIEKALDEINKVKYVQPPIQLWVKFLLSKIYYEMNYTEQLYSHIDTFRHYINNNKLFNEERRNRISRYLNILNKLIKLKAEPKLEELNQIKLYLNDKNNIMNCRYKDWLLEKISELKKGAN